MVCSLKGACIKRLQMIIPEKCDDKSPDLLAEAGTLLYT